MYFRTFVTNYSGMKKNSEPVTPIEIDNILNEIGLRIRLKRKSMSTNYEDFARDHNFNKVTISRIENGENYTLKTLILVARTIGISIEDLFKGIR